MGGWAAGHILLLETTIFNNSVAYLFGNA